MHNLDANLVEAVRQTDEAQTPPLSSAPYDMRVDEQFGEPGLPAVALRRRPRLSWRSRLNAGTPRVTTVELCDDRGQTVWSTADAPNDGHVDIPFDLPAYSKFTWHINVLDEDEQAARCVHHFETGPWDLPDWHARWVEVPPRALLSRTFASNSVASARLYLTGQGIMIATLNGVAVNADRIDPSRTDLSRALYRTFDVGPLLLEGSNTLQLTVGQGEWHKTGLDPRALVQLRIVEANGLVSWIVPDETWLVESSQIEVDEPFYLERLRPNHHPSPTGSLRTLNPVDEPADARTPPTRVEPDGSPPVRARDTVAVHEISRVDGARQYDVGVNIAGRSRVELRSELPAGTTVSVIHGEHLDQRGRLDTTNITMPYDRGRERQVLERVCAGQKGEIVEAVFAYHGFRYLEVRGLPDDAKVAVTARPLHSDLAARGTLSIDNPLITKLIEQATRTALNNVHGVPEDCPTREQAAWTGDLASAADFHFAHFDEAAFMEKWLGDLATSQGADGAIPGVAPNISPTSMPADPIWGAALHRVMWNHWLHVGDERVIHKFLPSLRRWTDYQLTCIGKHGVADSFPISYGQDWLALEQTPATLIHSGAVIDSLSTLALLEAAAGDPAAVTTLESHIERLRGHMRETFLDIDGATVGNGSQGSLAVALESGMLTQEEEARIANGLADRVRRRGNRVSGGFALTRSIVRALAAHGHSALVLACLEQTTEPGIGAMLASGPGTFWENWWIDPANTGTGSLDHIGLGAPFAAWAWEHVLGIQPTDRGYRRFEIRPKFLAAVPAATASFPTPLGTVAVSYKHVRTENDARVAMSIDVPHGAVANVVLADAAPLELGPGHHELLTDAMTAPTTAPAPASPGWTAPSIAPPPDDERDGIRLDLSARKEPGIGAPDEVTLESLICMPVPHAQYEHQITRHRASEPTDLVTVLLRLNEAITLDGTGFLHASIDQCLDTGAIETQLVLIAHLADSTQHHAVARRWPASWNRVVVDLRDVIGELIAVEVGVRALGGTASDALGLHESSGLLGFHLGEVGFAPNSPRW